MGQDAVAQRSTADAGRVPRAFTPMFAVLDPLRALGALAVVVTHTTFWTGDYLRHGVFGSMLARLNVGVAIFFVLSGFLLSHHYLSRAWNAAPAEPTRRYFWKRFLRIYPAYFAAVVLAMAFVEDNANATATDWLAVLLIADIYASDIYHSGLTQMWSLATEVAFYCLLPLLMLVATGADRRRPTSGRVLGLVAAMAAVNVVWTLFLQERVQDAIGTGVTSNWLPSYLMWFGAGIALAWAHLLHQSGHTNRWVDLLVSLGRLPGVCWSLALGLLVVAATPLGGPTMLAPATTAEALTSQVLYAAIGTLIVITGVFNCPGSHYTRVMSTPVLRHLGHISYSVFCVHLAVLHFVMWVTPYEIFVGTNGLQVLGLTLLITLPLSELLYRVVELPAMRLRRPGRSADDIASTTATRTAS